MYNRNILILIFPLSKLNIIIFRDKILVMKRIFYWLFTVSRGYSAPMSILNWFVAFTLIMKFEPQANVIYGLVALIGILFAHLGTNLFDDCIDYLLKIPKQKCKTEYLDSGFTTIKTVFIVTGLYFLIALGVGIFFIYQFGLPILYICLSAFLMIILYPKLNNFALGELAVGLCFGVLLFSGLCYVMTGSFNLNLTLISIPVSLLTVAVLYTHALMDFDFDKQSGKFTLCQLLKTKQNALTGLMGIYFAAFAGTIFLIIKRIIPAWSCIIVLLFPLVIKLFFNMQKYISKTENGKEEFLINFKLSRNISVFYNIILTAVFLIWG